MMKNVSHIAGMLVAGLLTLSAQADVGIFGSFIQVNGTWYQTSNPGPTQTTAFNGYDFGVVNSLVLSGASVLTYKNTGGDVTGAQVWWFVDGGFGGSGIEGISFGNEIPATDPLGNTYNTTGDQNWQGSLNTDVADGLAPGNHTLSLFYRMTSNEGEYFDPNGGPNYTASFTIVPEPSSLLLGLAGLIGLAVVRRRR